MSENNGSPIDFEIYAHQLEEERKELRQRIKELEESLEAAKCVASALGNRRNDLEVKLSRYEELISAADDLQQHEIDGGAPDGRWADLRVALDNIKELEEEKRNVQKALSNVTSSYQQACSGFEAKLSRYEELERSIRGMFEHIFKTDAPDICDDFNGSFTATLKVLAALDKGDKE